MRRAIWRWLLIGSLLLTTVGIAVARNTSLEPVAYLPLTFRPPATPPPPAVEARALWISRFEWTSQYNLATPARIDEIVAKASNANFNMLLFQVRGTGDAYYTPGLEPWSARLNASGELGQDPGWDPLAKLIESAHAAGLQVHAYLNVYPAWYGDTPPTSNTVPLHPFWSWSWASAWDEWRLWDQNGAMNLNDSYLFASPGAGIVADHIVAVATDIAGRYQLDGIHLDYIRYAGPQYSCDPLSEGAFGGPCFSPGWEDWQRDQISNLVARIYQAIPAQMTLSAAVWPVYQDRWNWGIKESYSYYYQDSQRWLQTGVIDALMPMIYPANYTSDIWTLDKFTTLVNDFQAHAAGRWIIAGIGAGYDDFDSIATRIETARAAGTAGHALFSYSGLDSKNHWNAFVAPGGPHEEPALAPTRTGNR